MKTTTITPRQFQAGELPGIAGRLFRQGRRDHIAWERSVGLRKPIPPKEPKRPAPKFAVGTITPADFQRSEDPWTGDWRFKRIRPLDVVEALLA